MASRVRPSPRGALLVGVCLVSASVGLLAQTLICVPAPPPVVTPPPPGTIVFEAAFNDAQCAAWNQTLGLSDAVVCQPGDHISGYGGWKPAGHPNGDEITSAANHTLAGGKGFRHWRGDGTNVNGGGLSIAPFPSGVSELWARYWVRWQAGFKWTNTNPNYTKDLYWNNGASNFLIFGHQGGAWGLYSGAVGNVPGSLTWSQEFGSAVSDGLWHCHEYHLKASGGVVELWIDGVSKLARTGLTLVGPWYGFTLGDNQAYPSNGQDEYTDFDDLAFSVTGPVGCS